MTTTEHSSAPDASTEPEVLLSEENVKVHFQI